jgi:hypothetical protein
VAAHTIAVCATDNQRRHLRGSPPASTGDDVPRYRFHVVAPNVAEAVIFAGGLICDRAMAGWEVRVLVAGAVEVRAVQILGAIVANLGTPSAGPVPHLLAVAADLFVANRSVHDLVLGALDSGATGLLLWGRRPPLGLNGTVHAIGHRPSVTAQAFKAHALAAQGTCCSPEMPEERFLSAT